MDFNKMSSAMLEEIWYIGLIVLFYTVLGKLRKVQLKAIFLASMRSLVPT